VGAVLALIEGLHAVSLLHMCISFFNHYSGRMVLLLLVIVIVFNVHLTAQSDLDLVVVL
jgi:hypothetical protein